MNKENTPLSPLIVHLPKQERRNPLGDLKNLRACSSAPPLRHAFAPVDKSSMTSRYVPKLEKSSFPSVPLIDRELTAPEPKDLSAKLAFVRSCLECEEELNELKINIAGNQERALEVLNLRAISFRSNSSIEQQHILFNFIKVAQNLIAQSGITQNSLRANTPLSAIDSSEEASLMSSLDSRGEEGLLELQFYEAKLSQDLEQLPEFNAALKGIISIEADIELDAYLEDLCLALISLHAALPESSSADPLSLAPSSPSAEPLPTLLTEAMEHLYELATQVDALNVECGEIQEKISAAPYECYQRACKLSNLIADLLEDSVITGSLSEHICNAMGLVIDFCETTPHSPRTNYFDHDMTLRCTQDLIQGLGIDSSPGDFLREHHAELITQKAELQTIRTDLQKTLALLDARKFRIIEATGLLEGVQNLSDLELTDEDITMFLARTYRIITA